MGSSAGRTAPGSGQSDAAVLYRAVREERDKRWRLVPLKSFGDESGGLNQGVLQMGPISSSINP